MWIRAAAGLLVAAVLVATARAETYKWVDDQGNVHYSDSIPPDEAGARREREIKSDRGVTVKRVEPPPTREELDARARRHAQAEAQARAEAEQRERDRILLRTYDSLEAMKAARDERLHALEAHISLARDRLQRLDERRQALADRAAGMERKGSDGLEGVYERIDSVREQMRSQREYIQRQRREKARVRARFEVDMARYRALTDDDG
ncbi:hypothetical protein KBTX_02480 [wastewater metagenome]|uniref:DUF4124 domain-containing protein n=2 Tax=unclassified sequences TaxID=12908 RepID=A0A5B8RBH2_9ZZZZ|nr:MULTISPECIES: DUF4124 domain-containing protein [Arhodomonas]MCS4503019.1 DUF4124 domain-containing protein [Arhodomonas aquaeolei]QEA06150.1 hypothetical protein KBTEX_02480 [uncultured organism]